MGVLLSGCANITTPPGGKKDKTPPKLLEVTPPDSMLNTRVSKLVMRFDEYVTVGDAATEVQTSPIIARPPTVIGINKTVTLKITDSLLDSNTTYRISFGNAIKDLHEGNIFKKYTYVFSTGGYFDSLALNGTVVDAATGLPDTTNVIVVLYPAAAKDSDVIRRKPKYAVKVKGDGTFTFTGLPAKNFRIYALKEAANGNLFYDGPPTERIAFNDSLVNPGDSMQVPINLRLFQERPDSAKIADSIATKKRSDSTSNHRNRPKPGGPLSYSVNVDTTKNGKRTFDFAHNNVQINFTGKTVFNGDKVTLSYLDDDSVEHVSPINISSDTVHPLLWQVSTKWLENTLYTLKLAKGFAKDTGGGDLLPSRYRFRTLKDEDYGKLKIVFPAKYNDTIYVLRVGTEKDSVYQGRIRDSVVVLKQLKPDKYTFRIIVDANRNGIWDTGDLLAKRQPELVIPYTETVNLKAGWELIVDFDQKLQPKKDKRKETKDDNKGKDSKDNIGKKDLKESKDPKNIK